MIHSPYAAMIAIMIDVMTSRRIYAQSNGCNGEEKQSKQRLVDSCNVDAKSQSEVSICVYRAVENKHVLDVTARNIVLFGVVDRGLRRRGRRARSGGFGNLGFLGSRASRVFGILRGLLPHFAHLRTMSKTKR